MATGNLSDQLVPKILFSYHDNAQSGTLIFRKQQAEKKIFVENGTVVYASGNTAEDDLGEFLLRIGRLSPSQLEQARRAAGSSRFLDRVLIETGLLSQSQLREFLELQVPEIIYPIFDWSEGEFELKKGQVLVDPSSKLALSTKNLIFEGIRRIKNPVLIHKGLKDANSFIRLAAKFESKVADLNLKPDEAFVLTRIESPATISEILQVSPLGLEMTQKTLYGLISTGIVEFLSQGTDPAATRSKPNSGRVGRRTVPTFTPEPLAQNDSDEDLEAFRPELLLMQEYTKTKNYYDLLSVAPNASAEEIKKSYYALAKKYHPDRYHQSQASDLKDALDVVFSALSQAYDTLKVPATRASYDAKTLKSDTPRNGSTAEKPIATTPSAHQPQHKLAEVNYKQGRGHFEQQDYWNAVQSFRQSVRLDPENPRYRYWLGNALTKNPKWRREAEEHFLKAIELEQFNPANHVGLGLLYREAGLTKRAEAQFKQALQVAPDNPTAIAALQSLTARSEKGRRGLGALKGLFRRK